MLLINSLRYIGLHISMYFLIDVLILSFIINIEDDE